ncbi:FAD binding domain-containing protein [Salininema proteolyticum]|uniref:FAD binding domain-containing protein n=1 Tax=Salininema proteolyticum TaxID=1607685 RepID=A0ABV8U4I7_9ACTN
MDFHRPNSLAEALETKASHPGTVPVSGGTDVMVEMNFDVHRPESLMDLNGVKELEYWSVEDGVVRIGATLPYVRIIEELGDRLPGLAQAARTVGSPQIRNRGSLGGNLGAASPAGDGHPPLLAVGAEIELASTNGKRTVKAEDFFTGVKRSVLEPNELITAVLVPEKRGPQQFSKIGTRNAMVIAVCAFAIALDTGNRAVGTGVGSAAPTPRRAREAEELLERELPWETRGDLDEELARRFGELVSSAASPIDDVRGSAAYRLHALATVARRALGWAWKEYQCD